MFKTDLQQFVFYDKYSRWRDDLGRRETWEETVERCVGHLRFLGGNALSEETYSEIEYNILNGRVMPSMRLLASAGEQATRNPISLYNCFKRDTEFLTVSGVKSFWDFQDGDSVIVLDHEGSPQQAKVRNYGPARMKKLELHKGRHVSKPIYVTENHRWLLSDNSQTTELKTGDYLLASPAVFGNFEYEQASPLERLYWCYGFVYGDGTKVKDQNGEYRYSMVRLCGKDVKYESRFLEMGFSSSSSLSIKGDVMMYTGGYLKTLPDPEVDSIANLRAFVRGYLDADGAKNNNPTELSSFKSVTTYDPTTANFIKTIFPIVGVHLFSEEILDGTETNYGKREFCRQFRISTNLTNRTNGRFKVVFHNEWVEEDAWCLEVENTHSFLLNIGVATGNCAFLGVDAIESFAEALYISMSGCGVGFSVEKKYIDQLPDLPPTLTEIDAVHVVADSAEGWFYAVKDHLYSLFNGKVVTFDYSLVRPKGAVLKTKGGRASGPEPLKELLDFITLSFIQHYEVDSVTTNRHTKYMGLNARRLSSLEVFDIMCYVGNCAVSGGSRRTAMLCLFDLDDGLMKNAKTGSFPQTRHVSNNSAVWPEEGIEFSDFAEWMAHLFKHDNGEYSVWNPASLKLIQHRRITAYVVGVNPCGEINLRHCQFCNLSSLIARHTDTIRTLSEKIQIAALVGTIQAMATDFPLLRALWKYNCEEERLLGVDLNGIMDCPLLVEDDGSLLLYLRETAVNTNKWAAKKLGINPSVAVTCVKPNGNSSELLGCSSGMKPREARYYKRRVRVSTSSPVYKVLFQSGIALSPENGQTWETMNTAVATFYEQAPEEAKLQVEFMAVEMCEFWKKLKVYYTEHNPSVTVRYTPEEKPALFQWLWDNRTYVGGMTFLPVKQTFYEQAPFEEISKEEWDKAPKPRVNWSLLAQWELEDMTTSSQELSCSSGSCELI